MEAKRKVFITGASRGIGKELALKYSSDSDVFLFARNEVVLSQICDYLNEVGCKANFFAGDAGNREDIKNAVRQANEIMGGIDLAILNAGISEHINIRHFDSSSFENTVRINLLANAYCLEELIPVMRDKGGIIAGVSSIADFRSMPGSSSYAASKIAFSYLLEAARIELKGIGIRVVTIRFGFIKTDMIKKNNFYMPLKLEAEECARRIVEGIDKGKERISFPLPMVWLTNFARILPAKLYEKVIEFRVRD